MKVLVTGGSGYLGTHLRRFFDADDLSRRAGKDILNTADAAWISEFDLVIHAAALLDKSPDAVDDVFETNVRGTRNILENMREGAALVFLSTKDVYGRFADGRHTVDESCPVVFSGQSSLEWSKLIAEKYVQFFADRNRLRSCIFRLSAVYAPPSQGNVPGFAGHYVNAINTGEPISLPGDGTAVRDLLHVDDLARACSAFAGSVIRHGLYNLGGGLQNAVALRDLVKKMEEVSGLQAVIESESQIPEPIPHRYVSDLSLVSQELDWAPEISLDAGLRTLFG